MSDFFDADKKFSDAHSPPEWARHKPAPRQKTLVSSVASTVAIGLALVCGPGVTHKAPTAQPSTQYFVIDQTPIRNNFREEFRQAREFLGLSQEEAAVLLHVAPSSIEKFEQGQITAPKTDAAERYQVLVDLAKLYEQSLPDKSLAPKMLRIKMPDSGMKTALEYAKNGPKNAIFWIYSSEHRMLA